MQNLGKRAFVLLAGLTLASCDGEKDAPEQLVLTVNIGDQFILGAQEPAQHFMYITNENDDVLDLEPFEENTSIQLETNKAFEKISLTLLTITRQGGVTDYHFTTYVDVQKNGIVTLGVGLQGLTRLPIGDVSVSIRNYNESDVPEMALLPSTRFNSAGYIFQSTTFADGVFTGHFPLWDDPADLLVTGFREGKPMYIFVDSVENGDLVELDFNDFQPQPHSFDVDGEIGSVTGYKNGTGYVMSTLQQQAFTNSPDLHPRKLAYLPGYDNYLTTIESSYDDVNFRYFKRGQALTSFTPPSFPVTINSKSITNLQFTTTFDYDLKRATWYRNGGFETSYWTVFAKADDMISIKNIPAELIKQFPFLDVTRYTMNGLMLKKNLGEGSVPLYEPLFLGDEFEFLEISPIIN